MVPTVFWDFFFGENYSYLLWIFLGNSRILKTVSHGNGKELRGFVVFEKKCRLVIMVIGSK